MILNVTSYGRAVRMNLIISITSKLTDNANISLHTLNTYAQIQSVILTCQFRLNAVRNMFTIKT